MADLNWFVIHTYSGHERKVIDALKERIEALGLKEEITELFMPTQEKIVIDAGKKKTGAGSKPTSLPEHEVDAIMKFSRLEAPKFELKFKVGETIKIIDGPFTDFLGKVDEIDEEKGKVKVLVSVFGRETPVELDFLQVARI